MKLVEESKILPNGGGTIKVVPEEPDDLWLLYNLISKGDVIVADTSRKSPQGRVKLRLEIKITAFDYDKISSVIRVAGKNLVANQHVAVGAFHTVEIERNKPFGLTKKVWCREAIEDLRAYCESAEADLTILQVQDGSADLYLIGRMATTHCAHVEGAPTNNPKNSGNNSKAGESKSRPTKIFENVFKAFIKYINFKTVRLVVIASSVGSEFRQYLLAESRKQKLAQVEENNWRLVVVKTSVKASLKAVLQEAEVVNLIRETNGAMEIRAWKELCDMLNNNSSRACYGPKTVEKANELMAIETLYLSDELYRSAEHETRRRYVDLVKSVKKAGGKALVYSSNHVMGDELRQLTGVAATLRFPIASHLDEEDFLC